MTLSLALFLFEEEGVSFSSFFEGHRVRRFLTLLVRKVNVEVIKRVIFGGIGTV